MAVHVDDLAGEWPREADRKDLRGGARRWRPWRICLLIVITLGPCLSRAAELVSGERLRVGGDGRGPLSAGLSNYPLGTAFVFGPAAEGRQPDVFVAAGRFSHEPGLFLYRWSATAADGTPVFADRVGVRHPGDTKVPPTGMIFQARSGVVYGFWLNKGTVVRTRFDPATFAFEPLPAPPFSLAAPAASGTQMNPDNRTAERFTVMENDQGELDLVFSVSDGTSFRPPSPPGSRDPLFQPFDGRGIWRGGWPYVFLRAGRLETPVGSSAAESSASSLHDVRDVSATRREALLSHGGITVVDLGTGHERDILTGSHFGNFYYYPNTARRSGVVLAPHELVRDTAGDVLRSPLISATPLAFPMMAGPARGRYSNLIVGGEGALFHLAFTGLDENGRPRYAGPLSVKEENALLYTGTLPVVNAADWDGDGATDLVIGNSEGKVLFFPNAGSTRSPRFAPGEPLLAGGVTLHVQQGYWGIQGPGEARWGYISPTVVDWNGDGLPDLVSSDATARHVVYLNRGSRRAPRLDPARTIYCDGLELHGTWRVRPAAARWNERMAYVSLDDDDQFHVYWRIDDTNVEDGGKLRLEDGSPIGANFLSAGGTGRSKISLVDWDRDGAMDLLVGTPRHGSVPNPKTGLPQSKGLPGAAVLWLRNTGTDTAPRFAFPLILQVRGKPVYLGQHECSVAATDLGGGSGGSNLIVGDEEGRVYFFRREDITWAP